MENTARSTASEEKPKVASVDTHAVSAQSRSPCLYCGTPGSTAITSSCRVYQPPKRLTSGGLFYAGGSSAGVNLRSILPYPTLPIPETLASPRQPRCMLYPRYPKTEVLGERAPVAATKDHVLPSYGQRRRGQSLQAKKKTLSNPRFSTRCARPRKRFVWRIVLQPPSKEEAGTASRPSVHRPGTTLRKEPPPKQLRPLSRREHQQNDRQKMRRRRASRRPRLLSRLLTM